MKESYGEGLANHTSLESCGNLSEIGINEIGSDPGERPTIKDVCKKRTFLELKAIILTPKRTV